MNMENLVVKPQVEFMEAVKMAFKNIVTFKGRSRRSEFWWAELAFIIIMLILGWIPVVGQLVGIVIALTNLSLTFRRLHDTNHSGWWVGVPMIISFIAIIVLVCTLGLSALTGDMDAMAGASIGSSLFAILLYIIAGILQIVVLVFCCMDSEPTTNKYGESPKYVVEQEN